MQRLFLFLFVLGLSLLCKAQKVTSTSINYQLKITVSNNQLTLQVDGKPIPLGSLQALDSCLRQVMPGIANPSFLVESEEDTDKERMRQVGVILERYHCPVAGFRKRNVAPPPPLTRKADTSGH